MKTLFASIWLTTSICSASTIQLRSGQVVPFGNNTVSCGQSITANPCVIDLEKSIVTINGRWGGGTDAGLPLEGLIEIAQYHEKSGACYGITLK